MSSDEDEATTGAPSAKLTGEEETGYFEKMEKKRLANAAFRGYAKRDTKG